MAEDRRTKEELLIKIAQLESEQSNDVQLTLEQEITIKIASEIASKNYYNNPADYLPKSVEIAKELIKLLNIK